MKTVIELALEAGILEPIDLLDSNQWRQDTIRELERFVELARADEREACAKVCEEQYEYYGHDHVFAAVIRARKTNDSA